MKNEAPDKMKKIDLDELKKLVKQYRGANAPLDPNDYPFYFKSAGCFYAFLGPTQMVKIAPIGSNTGNTGLCMDFYKTRKMVLEHWKNRYAMTAVSPYEFAHLMWSMFEGYMSKILIVE